LYLIDAHQEKPAKCRGTKKKWYSWQTAAKICFLGYLAHVGAAVELKWEEKGGEKEL
jgi:hypothetical protein